MTSLIERVLFLKKTAGFTEIDTENLIAVARELRVDKFSRGATLVTQGVANDRVFYIQEGVVRIIQRRDEGDIPITTLSAYESIGEMSFLSGALPNATCIAETNVVCLSLETRKFAELLSEHSVLGWGIIRVLSRRLAATTQLVGR